ncbi:MAG TPA: hypothetical protein VIV40_07810 [Kofleriaceae bacterium]
MLVSASGRQPITHVFVAILLFSACAKKAAPDDKPPDKAGPTAPASTAPAPPKSAPVPAKPAPRNTLAKRCVLGGDPLPADCVGGGEGLAFGKDGLLYVVDGKHVRRYQRAAGDACSFEPSGEPIELPPDNVRPQPLDKGPVYMRSGGAAWHLVRGGDAVYAHDFLGGLFRIDRGKPEPACVDVFGYNSVAAVGKKLLANRTGIVELRLGKQCSAVPAKIDDKARGDLYAAHGKLYLASGSELTRYDGATPTKLGEGTRICYVTGLTSCGDGACLVDSNCMQMVQLAADGKVLRVLDDDKLFATRPWSIAEATTSDAGDVYVLARHRDKTNDKEICEAAIYEVPAAAFAL